LYDTEAEICAEFVMSLDTRDRSVNTLRTGAFKLFKCTFPGFKQYKSTFVLFL